ncbi:MAG TPA: hypothetical protein VMS17_17765 [Gemmataceae bacterium]|nr:hypothetical protein [Gemmataceae bacterium]
MTTATHNAADLMTTVEMAGACGVPPWQLQAAMRRGFIQPPRKVGPLFAWPAGDLERVRRGLREAGNLPAETAPDGPAA